MSPGDSRPELEPTFGSEKLDDGAWVLPERLEDIPESWPDEYKLMAIAGLARRAIVRAEEAEEKNRHDELTGVLTERALMEHIAEDQKQNPGAPRALIFIDLGNFKRINALLGHEGGNTVLKLVAKLFLRDTDVVARIGGDEFVIYLDPSPRIPKQDDYKKVEEDTDFEERTPTQVLQNQITRIEAIRYPVIERFPELDHRPIRFFVNAGAALYDPSLSYKQNRDIAELAAQARKEEQHKEYGVYRTAESRQNRVAEGIAKIIRASWPRRR